MPIVSIKDSNRTYEVKSGEVLYDALFDQGEELPHGCLSGSCGACRIEVTKGIENLLAPGVIEQNTIEALRAEFTNIKGRDILDKTIRLSCRAKVFGDVVIIPIK